MSRDIKWDHGYLREYERSDEDFNGKSLKQAVLDLQKQICDLERVIDFIKKKGEGENG